MTTDWGGGRSHDEALFGSLLSDDATRRLMALLEVAGGTEAIATDAYERARTFVEGMEARALLDRYVRESPLVAALVEALREAAAHIESLTRGYGERYLGTADLNALTGRALQARAAIRLAEEEK